MSTFYNLPLPAQEVTLFTHLAIREDAHQLFGFGTAVERSAFKQLIKVSGIGAKTALSVLSGMTVTDLAHAVNNDDSGRITSVPGIGKKTAERLVLELKGKIIADGIASCSTATIVAHDDVRNALVALGYSDKEASAATKLLPGDAGVSEGIKLALKFLSKS